MQQDAADVLGIPRRRTRSQLWILNEINDGLPISALDRVIAKYAPTDHTFIYCIIPKATLARRKKNHRTTLSVDESAKLVRLAAVWSFAREIWGSDDEARSFLFRPHPLLDGKAPVDVVLANEFGRPIVEGILGRLQYGSAV